MILALTAFLGFLAQLVVGSGQKGVKPSAVIHLDQDWLTSGVNGRNIPKKVGAKQRSPRMSPSRFSDDDGLPMQLSMAYYGHDDAIPKPNVRK